jgi:arylsulfatase A-like enzyme
VREADAHVGRIVEILRRRGLLESTIIIVTSDHGESFGEKNLITHAFGNAGDRESTHRVPLLWRFPSAYGIRPGKITVPTALNDIAPTIYDLVGIDWLPIANLVEIPGTFGKSLLAYLGEPVRKRALAAADLRREPRSDSQKAEDKKEAEARLRALGYIQ